jgi:type VI protein secretion system component Hcp
MPGDAPADIYVRFEDASGENVWKQSLMGESWDQQFPGALDDGDSAFGIGWFFVTSFQFSISGDGAGGGGAAGGVAGKGAPVGGHGGSGTASSKDAFKGLSVTLPMQVGCTKLMQLCVQWAQKQQKQQHFEKIPRVTFVVRRPGMSNISFSEQSSQGCFLWVYLSNVTVDSYTMNSSCIQETFTLNYEKMEIEYYATDPDTRDLADKNSAHGYAYHMWSINAEDDDDDDD